MRDVCPELEGQGFRELLDGVWSTGQACSSRATAIRLAREAADRFIDMRYQPIRDGAGRITGIFVSGYDVTEAIRIAGALRRLNERVEKEVSARARERSRTWAGRRQRSQVSHSSTLSIPTTCSAPGAP